MLLLLNDKSHTVGAYICATQCMLAWSGLPLAWKYIWEFGQIHFIISTNTFQFGEMSLAIPTNICATQCMLPWSGLPWLGNKFGNLDKYILQFQQLHYNLERGFGNFPQIYVQLNACWLGVDCSWLGNTFVNLD